MLKKLTPNLVVDDVGKPIEFCQDILGCFELITTDSKDDKIDWALRHCEDVEIMLRSNQSLSLLHELGIKRLWEIKIGSGDRI